MSKSNRTIRAFFGLSAVLAVAAAEAEAGSAGKDDPPERSLSESPYENGPPPSTGGFTDTSQGGTKGTGTLSAPPGNLTEKSRSKNGDSRATNRGAPAGSTR